MLFRSLYAVTIAGAITSVAGFYGNLQEAAGAARRIFELLDRQPDLRDPPDPRPLPRPVQGVVRFEGSGDRTRVRIEMEGRTRTLVPEFTIKGPMQDQLAQMADSLKRRIESAGD